MAEVLLILRAGACLATSNMPRSLFVSWGTALERSHGLNMAGPGM